MTAGRVIMAAPSPAGAGSRGSVRGSPATSRSRVCSAPGSVWVGDLQRYWRWYHRGTRPGYPHPYHRRARSHPPGVGAPGARLVRLPRSIITRRSARTLDQIRLDDAPVIAHRSADLEVWDAAAALPPRL